MPYTIAEHSHRLAAWAAATSASASPLCRFKVEDGVAILEACGFDSGLTHPDQLPTPDDFDCTHREWRKAVITSARKKGHTFTHGVAAKLINCYLKIRFVCAGHDHHPRVSRIHPPIDAVLLNALSKGNIGNNAAGWRRFHQARWSKFDSITYESVIALIQGSLTPKQPLWMIEEHWQGHQ